MNKLLTLNILILLLVSCISKEKKEAEVYVENKVSFFGLNHSDWTKSTWIRKPENLKMVHESFKKFGYNKLENLIFKSDNLFILNGVYIKRDFDTVMDSLQLTYHNPETTSKYYSEFWNRRKSENNDSIVYDIIREINSLKSRQKLNYENQYVNDTLVDLLIIEFDNDNLNSEKAKTDFYTLRKYGLHQSAYNLLYERTEYSELDLDREKLKMELSKATEFTYPWLVDTEK